MNGGYWSEKTKLTSLLLAPLLRGGIVPAAPHPCRKGDNYTLRNPTDSCNQLGGGIGPPI